MMRGRSGLCNKGGIDEKVEESRSLGRVLRLCRRDSHSSQIVFLTVETGSWWGSETCLGGGTESLGNFRAEVGSEKSRRVIQGSLATYCCLEEKPLLPPGSLSL